jgi:preprotein translocase subunit SecD
VAQVLSDAQLSADYIQLEGNSVKARFGSTDAQLKAKDALSKALNTDPADPTFIVALNLVSRSPQWLTSLHALPMYLGLDLRGGVHFLMQVDMKAALDKKAESMTGDVRTALRDKNIRHSGISRSGNAIVVNFRDEPTRQQALALLNDTQPDMQWTPSAGANGDLVLTGELKPQSAVKIQQAALKQNITTLHNRVNELGVAEPVIQQQGLDRVVVQLPGVQDTAKAKDIIGRTATLELRMVDDSAEAARRHRQRPGALRRRALRRARRRPLVVKRQVVLTGENLTDAQPGFDDHQQPAVHLTVDAKGARIMRDITRENIGKRMAILLFEKGKGEVVTAPVIRGELGSRFQISGRMTTQEANDTALLLRAGSLAAPMEIIEERTIGPSLGADNIAKGFHSLAWGFAAIAVFMCLYYAVRRVLHAGPGLQPAAAGGRAVDAAGHADPARHRRHRAGAGHGHRRQRADQRAHARGTARRRLAAGGHPRRLRARLGHHPGLQHHHLIAGLALLAFGSGPVRGFAVVHCLGILTSMFSAVMFSRGLVNLWYGRQKKLKSVSIGQVWRPDGGAAAQPPSSDVR